MMCLCYENGSYDCNRNILGPVYPGQVLQLLSQGLHPSYGLRPRETTVIPPTLNIHK